MPYPLGEKAREEQKPVDNLNKIFRNMLENATKEDMERLEVTSPFNSGGALLLYVIGYAMFKETPETISTKFGISLAAAEWILPQLVGEIMCPDVYSAK